MICWGTANPMRPIAWPTREGSMRSTSRQGGACVSTWPAARAKWNCAGSTSTPPGGAGRRKEGPSRKPDSTPPDRVSGLPSSLPVPLLVRTPAHRQKPPVRCECIRRIRVTSPTGPRTPTAAESGLSDRLAYLGQFAGHRPYRSCPRRLISRPTSIFSNAIITTSFDSGAGSFLSGRKGTSSGRSTVLRSLGSAPVRARPWTASPNSIWNSSTRTTLQRLRSRVVAARDRGIYVSIMLFEGWGLRFVPDGWKAHPFHPANNVNLTDERRERHQGDRTLHPRLAQGRRLSRRRTSARSSTRSTIWTTCSMRSPTKVTSPRPSGSTT